MKYSLNLIKKYVPDVVTIPTEELIARIWSSVAEVQSHEDLGKKYEGIVVAKVLNIEIHPKSEKLVVVNIDVGQKEPITVVTAAHNLQKGDFVPYIPDGGQVPSVLGEDGKPLQIGIRSMAGIPSVGMLASEKELGISEDHDGIMILRQEELKKNLVVGEPIAIALELDDIIFEIENKSLTHRGDCFSAAGISREIATLYGLHLVLPDWQTPTFSVSELVGEGFDGTLACAINVEITATAAVERYSALALDGIQVQKSPLWLRVFLMKHGVSSISNVVDITNFIMLEYGQPMHAFDAATVTHKKKDEKLEYEIDVRYAKAGESIMTLDGKEKKLPPIVTLIADAKKALGIAGIIGGKESGISENSTRIILESAVFNKYAIRNASMSIGTTTDASVVFSRKQDPEKTVRALLRAVHLLQEMAGAKIASSIVDVYPPQRLLNSLVVSHLKLEEFLGIAVSPVRVIAILEGLGCQAFKKNGMYRINSPSWRHDIAIDEDVYEEIARIIGYKEILPELPKRGIFGVSLSSYEKVKQATLKVCTALGMTQAMNFSFVSKELYDRCMIPIKEARSITNAISPEVQYIRKQMIPSLLEQLAKNQHNVGHFGLFEMGKVSRKGLSYTGAPVASLHMPESQFGLDELGLPIEDEHIAIGIVDDSLQPGFFTLKQVLTKYLQELHIDARFTHPEDAAKRRKSLPSWAIELLSLYKKGRTALVFDNKNDDFLGVIGEPGTLVLKAFGLTKQLAIAELSLNKIASSASLEPVYKEPSKYPMVTEDFCFEVPISVSYASILSAFATVIEQLTSEVTVKVYPRDIYQKKESTKQVTNRVVYTPNKASLTDTQIKLYKTKFIAEMRKLDGNLV